MNKIASGFRDFGKGLSVIFSKPKEGEGDRKLAKVSLMVEAQINSYTKHRIRKTVLDDVERILKKEAKKGGKEAVEAKISLCFATPEWVHMLHRLDVNEAHIRIIANGVMKEAIGNKGR